MEGPHMKLTRRQAMQLGLIGASSWLFPLDRSQPAWAEESSSCCLHPAYPPEPPITGLPITHLSEQIGVFNREFRPLTQLPPKHRYEGSSASDDHPIDFYEITLQKAEHNIVGHTPTQVWTYNGIMPGPVIWQQGGSRPEDRGRTSSVRFINRLGTTEEQGQTVPLYASIHLHGMASLPEYDGYAEDLIPPDYYKDYYYPNDRAAGLWYHDHTLDKTSRNVYMGLVGMYIVQDQEERDFNLPSGPYDVPIVLQDVRLDLDGQLVFYDRAHRSVYGDVPLVNGVPWPVMVVEGRKYRFRFLNASASRTFQLTLSQDPDRQTWGDRLVVIGTDAGLLPAPVPLVHMPEHPFQPLRISPAERYGVVIDFSVYEPGTKLYLRSPAYPSNLDSDRRGEVLMMFEIGARTKDDSELPPKLREFESLVEKAQSLNRPIRERTFRFERSATQWLINNKAWEAGRVDANPQPGDFEIWNLVNAGGGWIHPVHIHLVDCQLLSRNGQLPPLHERGWKDVFRVEEFETVRVIAEFSPRNDASIKKTVQGKYMMHCHNLVHEDHMMMTQFEVGKGYREPCSVPAKPIAEMRSLW